MHPQQTKLQHYFFFTLFIGTLYLMYYIYQPFLSAIIVALALAIVFHPLYKKILKRCRAQSLSVLLTILIIFIVVLIPLLVVAWFIFNEAVSLYTLITLQGGSLVVANHITSILQHYIQKVSPHTTINIAGSVQYLLQWVVAHLDGFFAGSVSVFLGFIVTFFGLFYLLKDGEKMRAHYLSLSPLSNTYDEQILTKVTSAVNSVVKGSLFISCIQGLVASLGLYLFGIASPLIFGVCAGITSLIPGVGTLPIIIPAILYLFFTHHIGDGIGLIIWQICAMVVIDNMLSPYIINRGLHINSVFVLMAVLGGIVVFGPIGLLIGPMVLALFFALLDIYPLIIK